MIRFCLNVKLTLLHNTNIHLTNVLIILPNLIIQKKTNFCLPLVGPYYFIPLYSIPLPKPKVRIRGGYIKE